MLESMRMTRRQVAYAMLAASAGYAGACFITIIVGVALSYAGVHPASSSVIACGIVGLVGQALGLFTNPATLLELRQDLITDLPA